MKKFVLILAALTLGLSQVSCTSSSTSSDEEEVSTESTDAELEKVESEEGTEVSDAFLEETLPQEKLGEVASAEPVEEAPAEVATETPAPVESLLPTDTETPPVETAAVTEIPNETTAIVDTAETPSTNTAAVETTPEPQAQPAPVASDFTNKISITPGSLKKVDETPRKGPGGVWLNTVYIARPGDTFGKVSQRIFGSKDKVSHLRRSNSWISTLKPGNKVYYNSPKRPDDNSRVLTYFEEEGMAPEVYVAQEGDNIRSVSKKLLGYDNAWQEIWSTNSVVSRGDLQPGTELRFWKSVPSMSETAPVNVASNSTPPAQTNAVIDQQASVPAPAQEITPIENTPPAEMPPAQDMAAVQPPPVQEPAQELPPPPVEIAAAPPEIPPVQEMPPPPPPPMADSQPLPPPVDSAVATASTEEDGSSGGLFNSDTMMLGGAGALALGLVGLIIARKRRQQKDLAAFNNNAQVGT